MCSLQNVCTVEFVLNTISTSRATRDNVISMECVLFRMCSLQNVSYIECVFYGMCSLQNVFYIRFYGPHPVQGGNDHVQQQATRSREHAIENTFYRDYILWRKYSCSRETERVREYPPKKTGKKILGLPPGASCVNKTKNVGLVRDEVRLCVILQGLNFFLNNLQCDIIGFFKNNIKNSRNVGLVRDEMCVCLQ